MKVRKKSVIQPTTIVTKDWIKNAVCSNEGVVNCEIVKMDFVQAGQVNIDKIFSPMKYI